MSGNSTAIFGYTSVYKSFWARVYLRIQAEGSRLAANFAWILKFMGQLRSTRHERNLIVDYTVCKNFYTIFVLQDKNKTLAKQFEQTFFCIR